MLVVRLTIFLIGIVWFGDSMFIQMHVSYIYVDPCYLHLNLVPVQMEFYSIPCKVQINLYFDFVLIIL